MPTGDGDELAGALNQYLSIWSDVGSTLAGLQAQFDGVQGNDSQYRSGTASAPPTAWGFYTDDGYQDTYSTDTDYLFAVAVRPGDVATSVPEPQTLALVLLALGATAVARRRRPR